MYEAILRVGLSGVLRFRRDLCGADALWVRDRGADSYREFTVEDETELHDALDRAGRGRFWDL